MGGKPRIWDLNLINKAFSRKKNKIRFLKTLEKVRPIATASHQSVIIYNQLFTRKDKRKNHLHSLIKTLPSFLPFPTHSVGPTVPDLISPLYSLSIY